MRGAEGGVDGVWGKGREVEDRVPTPVLRDDLPDSGLCAGRVLWFSRRAVQDVRRTVRASAHCCPPKQPPDSSKKFRLCPLGTLLY